MILSRFLFCQCKAERLVASLTHTHTHTLTQTYADIHTLQTERQQKR